MPATAHAAPELFSQLSSLIPVTPVRNARTDAATSMTELELLRTIADATAKMFAAEHALDLRDRLTLKGEVYTLLIEWRQRGGSTVAKPSSPPASSTNVATASTLPPPPVMP